MLKVTNLKAGYGSILALKSIMLSVEQSEIVTIIGANGAGKTTLLKAIMGMIPAIEGNVFFKERPISGISTQEIVSLGIALVPEGRRIFGNLSTLENLKMGAYPRRDKEVNKDMEEVMSFFPVLHERRRQLGGTLSGGEQQMLAIARALMSRPHLLLLDEPSMGLAPMVVEQVFEKIKEINTKGTTILLVEQNAHQALELASRGYVMELGKVVLEDSTENLSRNSQVKSAYLGESN
jgi:branched-chain amino acid transport system ATP-binding protein